VAGGEGGGTVRGHRRGRARPLGREGAGSGNGGGRMSKERARVKGSDSFGFLYSTS